MPYSPEQQARINAGWASLVPGQGQVPLGFVFNGTSWVPPSDWVQNPRTSRWEPPATVRPPAPSRAPARPPAPARATPAARTPVVNTVRPHAPSRAPARPPAVNPAMRAAEQANAAYRQQLAEYNEAVERQPYMDMMSQQPQQFSQQMGGAEMSPVMLNDLMQGIQGQNTRYVPVKRRRSIHDSVMASFDPGMFSPEFIPEEGNGY